MSLFRDTSYQTVTARINVNLLHEHIQVLRLTVSGSQSTCHPKFTYRIGQDMKRRRNGVEWNAFFLPSGTFTLTW